ncbi:MATE family efflux transporter [Carnobacteriaceae bacterium zg-C25]|nr:MATE family efflux transporter [Carnobacteriaceae bacterium zg-C25]
METKNFYKAYAKVVIPLMLQGMITKFVSMIDNLMVGQLGDTSIASVAMGNKILDIIMFTVFGVSAAVSVFIAQYYGAQNVEKQKEVFRIGLLMSGTVFIVASSILAIFPQQVVHYFVQDATIKEAVLNYMGIMIIGYIPFVVSINYATALRVIGQVKMPLVASLASVAVNSIGNYMLIFGNFGFSPMGIQGAAIATVFSRIVEFTILIYFTKRYHFSFDTKVSQLFHVPRYMVREVMFKALPLTLNEIIWSFGQATILKTYGSRGDEALAALAITETTSSIFFAFAQGLAGATPIFISQLLGANRFKEAYQNSVRMMKSTVVVAVGLGALMFTMSFIVPNIYQVSIVSHQIATQTIQIASLFFWVYLTNTQCYFILRAGGDMKSTLIVDGLYMWSVTIPVISIIAYMTQLPLIPMYIIGQSCDLGKLVVSLTMFFKKKWLKNSTI